MSLLNVTLLLKFYISLSILASNAIFLHYRDLWSLPAWFWSHYIQFVLQTRSSIFYVVFFIFSLLLLFYVLQFVLEFFDIGFVQYDLIISVGGILYTFTISFPRNLSFISLFYLILQRSPSSTNPYIFLSNVLSAFVPSAVIFLLSDLQISEVLNENFR